MKAQRETRDDDQAGDRDGDAFARKEKERHGREDEDGDGVRIGEQVEHWGRLQQKKTPLARGRRPFGALSIVVVIFFLSVPLVGVQFAFRSLL